MANTLTIILALALIVCPVIIPVYESAGFDTVEIMQTTQDITRIDYTTYASQPKDGTPPVSKQEAELIFGDWHGTKSLFSGIVSAEFYLSADMYGNMTISGTAEEKPFTLDAKWTYLGDYQFRGEAQGSSIKFTCDGTKISLTANPYKLGLIDNKMANMDINIKLTRYNA